ncbi:MAG TPA: hypothetical protein VFS51_04205 [Gemmatimonadales bacterium]|nr:hypothetical protein [Gemmatimonadales bacterium]
MQALTRCRVTYSEDQISRIYRLGDKVICPRTNTGQSILARIQGGHQENWYHRRLLLPLEPTANLQSIKAWHHDVQEHDVRTAIPCQSQTLISICRRAHAVIAGLQQVSKEFNVLRLIIHNED